VTKDVARVLLMVLLLAGCSRAPDPRPAGSVGGSAAAWREPARYTFALRRTCGEGPLSGLFRRVTDARAAGAAVAQLVVDPVDGHPTRIEIDPDRNAIDDELCFSVSDYRAG
jgi:hypothetical protein